MADKEVKKAATSQSFDAIVNYLDVTRQISGNVPIRNETDLRGVIHLINDGIASENRSKPKSKRQPYLDEYELVLRYRKEIKQMSLSKFRKVNDCKSCVLYRKKCSAYYHCIMESDEDTAREKAESKKGCPKNGGKECPYANETGTCFGTCMVEALKVFKKKKGDE